MKRIGKGSVVSFEKQEWLVSELISLEELRLLHPHTGEERDVQVGAIEPTVSKSDRDPMFSLSMTDIERAQKIYEGIEPLLHLTRKSKEQMQAAADRLECTVPSIYKYLQTWKKYQRISAFTRKPRNDVGKSRLSTEVQKVINDIVDSYYGTLERRDIAATYELVKAICYEKGLPIPSLTPVKAAIERIPAKQNARARRGPKHVMERFEPHKGAFPNAEYPQAVYQIDHTPADVILVEAETRLPIGRAYLTIIIDVCTRVIAGFCISLEAPSATSAALALSHAILPKEDWLKKHNVKAEWPIWGKPRKVHADNAKEFRGTALTRGSLEHGITLENRPRGRPQYGGTVERAFRTFMRATQRLRGTTFGNTVDKLDYDSEGRAILTIEEYERWFAIYVTKRYHNKINRGIGYPPINYYKLLVEGTEEVPPIGLPEPIANPRALLLDFLPYVERTIQQSGVVNERVEYWDDVLRRWIGVKSLENPKESRQFVFVYDPRDLSTLYFYDPELKEYFPIPYKNRANPPVSLWEIKEQNKRTNQDPLRKDNESEIFQGVLQARAIEEEAHAETNRTRRRAARQKGWAKVQRTAARENQSALNLQSGIRPQNEQGTDQRSEYLSIDDVELPNFDE